jgi:DNA (cytosine-5)-methyltransferase 1
MTPTQVVRWVTELKVRTLLVENVPEFVHFGPLDRETLQPVKKKRGMYFRAWLRNLERAGFRVEWKILNAADYGDATTRQRFFLIGRSDRKPIRWPTPTHSKEGGASLFGSTARWRAAREVIDWSLKGRSIFTRKKPLSPKTLMRIYAGAVKFKWPEPFLVILRAHMDGRSLDEPVPTVCAAGNHIGPAQPVVFQVNQGGDRARNIRSIDAPLPTLVTRPSFGLAHPFVLPQHGGGVPREVEKPLPTVTADGAHALIAPYHRTARAQSVQDPLPTQTTRDRFGLVVPVGKLAFIAAAFGERPGQTPRVHSIEDPAPAICAKGRVQLVEGDSVVYDILFRMLRPQELARAMSFSDAEFVYEFVGNDTEITRQIGNAVPVRTAAALVGAILS